jgi:UDP-2-acetamido-2-deoxy-ribo-hexuluronate aminotransferase
VERANPSVPFIDLAPLTARVRERALASFAEVLDAHAFVQGPWVKRFEAELARASSAQHVVACANGTDALVLGLSALGVRPGMRVALPNLTFWASYEAIAQLGATPVLLDVDPHDLQLSFEALEAAQRTRPLDGCLFVHLFGWSSARLGDIRSFCAGHGIRLLEDGAQAFGVHVDGVPVLGSAELATTSFYPAKVLGGPSDGGAVLGRSEPLIARVRALANHGRIAHYAHDRVGFNSRMGGLTAAYLSAVLAMSDELLEARRRAAAHYHSALAALPSVRCYGPPEGQTGNGYLCVLGLPDGQAVERAVRGLAEAGVGCARTYPLTLDAQPGAHAAEHGSALDHSRAFTERVLNLPLYFGIDEGQQARAVAALSAALAEDRAESPTP